MCFGHIARDPKWTTKLLGCSREGINDLVWLKFGIFTAWVNPWWCFFFHFLKILIFGPWDSVWNPKWTRNLLINVLICLEFSILIVWVNPSQCVFIIWRFLFLGQIRGIFGLKFVPKHLECTTEDMDGLISSFFMFC